MWKQLESDDQRLPQPCLHSVPCNGMDFREGHKCVARCLHARLHEGEGKSVTKSCLTKIKCGEKCQKNGNDPCTCDPKMCPNAIKLSRQTPVPKQ